MPKAFSVDPIILQYQTVEIIFKKFSDHLVFPQVYFNTLLSLLYGGLEWGSGIH